MAEGKAVVPLNSHLAFGIGVLGAGDYQPGSSSTQATEGGVSYESSFAFERPRFQGVVSARHPRIGAVGIIATIGSDGRSVARDSTKSIASGGICVGLLSPPLYFPLYLSVAFSFIHHELHREFLDRIGKLGVLYRDEKGLVEGSLEYTFDMASDEKRGFGVFTPERSVYDILKVLVSVRVYRTVAALGGFSTDLGEKSDTPYFQGSSLHLGAELRRSSRFPFIGGYDLAFHPGRYWRILHRVWFGYRFGVEDF
jgi:hypothetical protein